MTFSPEQKLAIKHGAGPALVIAGPGSGKTRVLTNRIKYLIEDLNVPPEEILVITFSKAASIEMQSRFILLTEETVYPVNFGTFHSVFFQIINTQYHYNTSHILSLRDKRELMRKALIAANIIAKPETELIDAVLKEVGYYKNIGEREYAYDSGTTNITRDQFHKVYREYRNLQVGANKIDFEDMLLIVRNLFRKNEGILDYYRDLYKYILIDEYQDINDIQYDIVRMLAEPNNNLWVCGDDDQSIYGFRGANSKIMLDFINGYPEASVYRLSTNYRCSNNIIEAAGKVIAENKERYAKNIVGDKIDNVGHPVELMGFGDISEEDQEIVSLIKKKLDTGLPACDIAIFLRTNREASRYAELLRNAGIDCTMEEKAFNPYKTEWYKVFANYLMLALDGDRLSVEHLFPVMNKPSRYIRRDMIVGDSVSFEELCELYKDRTSMVNVIKTFAYQIKKLGGMDLYSGINYIRKGIRLDEYMKSNLSDDMYADYIQVTDWIQEASRGYRTIKEFDDYARSYEDQLEKKKQNSNHSGHNYVEARDDKTKSSKEGTSTEDYTDSRVHVMTYHASKGLEFDTVILPHVNEGSVPHKKSTGDDKIEEERRLFYVAMTRAKTHLIITYVKGTKSKPVLPSRFLYCLLAK